VELDRKPSASPAVGGRDEIGKVSRDGRECAIPGSTRKHIHGLAEGAKFESHRGIIIGLALEAGLGEPENVEGAKLQTAYRGRPVSRKRCTRKMQDARKLGTALEG